MPCVLAELATRARTCADQLLQHRTCSPGRRACVRALTVAQPRRYLLADKLLLHRVLPAPALGVLLAVVARLPGNDTLPRSGGIAPHARGGEEEGRREGAVPGTLSPLLAQAALKLAQVLHQCEHLRKGSDARYTGRQVPGIGSPCCA